LHLSRRSMNRVERTGRHDSCVSYRVSHHSHKMVREIGVRRQSQSIGQFNHVQTKKR
jgi:hypothetical protein